MCPCIWVSVLCTSLTNFYWNVIINFFWNSAQQPINRNLKTEQIDSNGVSRKILVVKSGSRAQNVPKLSFCFTFRNILSLLFAGSGLKWKTLQFLVLLLLFSCSRLIRLQDFLTTNISGSNASISLIFCVEISLRRGYHMRLSLLVGCLQACLTTPKFADIFLVSLWLILGAFPGRNNSELKIS